MSGRVDAAVLTAALDALSLGLNVFPPTEDGEKRPDTNEWGSRQRQRTTAAEVQRWYANGRTGLGFICGAVSGGLELFEFEGRAVEAGMADDFVDLAEATGLGEVLTRIAEGYTERSPSGGVHWLYRCTETSCTKLARQPDDLPLIETKGEGGYVITAPSHGRVHETGQPWVLANGGFATIATISPEERAALHRLARTFDQKPKLLVDAITKTKTTGDADGWKVRPGDDFAARTSWAELLEPHGWVRLFTAANGNQHWRRPGKALGTSATISDKGEGVLYVFSSSTSFEPDRGYSKFSAYVVLDHNGDADAAAKELVARNFGVPLDERKQWPLGGGQIQREWPELHDDALHGLVGDFVRTVDPHTEADPAALLIDFLVSFGSAVGPTPHAVADGARHGANLFAVVVGDTSRARKGTSRAQVRRPYEVADPEWSNNRVKGGLASGEGLIAALTRSGDGPVDRRLYVVEPEFARVLGVAGREGSTLSPIVRQAWDSGTLRVITRREPLEVSDAHVSILGHITEEELQRRLTDTEAANGFANRFIYVCARRSKLLPSGGSLPELEIGRIGRLCRHALEDGRRIVEVRRSSEAEELWNQLYREMADGDPGACSGW